jgi:hypothetical protein
VIQLRKSGLVLDLHPFVSIVRGLEGGLRAEFINAMSALPSGRDPGLAGLVEAHGVVLDLSPDALALLDLHESLDVVVRREDLPGRPTPPSADARAEAQRVAESLVGARQREVDDAKLALEAARRARDASAGATDPAFEAQLVQRLAERRAQRDAAAAAAAETIAAREIAQAAHGAVTAELERLRVREEQLRASRAAAVEACSVAAAELESARASRDPFAAAALEASREHLNELENEAARAEEGTGVVGPAATVDELNDLLTELRARRGELEASLVALDAGDRYQVETALAELRGAPPTERIPSVEAMALADEWKRLDEHLETVSWSGVGGDALADARRRLETARLEFFEAERDVRLPDVDRGAVHELEHAHAEVLDAQDKADGRLGGKRAQKRVDEARVREQAVLDRLGFATYAEFVMGTSISQIDPEAEVRWEKARRELAEAEDAWAALEADVDAELARAQLLERRRVLREEARRILGRDPGDDVITELRGHRVVATAIDDRAAKLQGALERAGLVVGDERVGADELIDLAQVWLDEEDIGGAHRPALERDLAEVEAKIAQADDELAEANARASGTEADQVRQRRRGLRLDEARGAVIAAEERTRRNAQAEAEVVARAEALEAASARERSMSDQLAAIESALADAVTTARGTATAADAAVAAAAAATDTLTMADDQLAQAEATLSAARQAPTPEDAAALHRRVTDAEALLAAAEAALAEAEGGAQAPADGDSPFFTNPGGNGQPTALADVDEVEWYLLARLAAQRAVSFAGSVPLVLDEALADLADHDVRRVLQRLERMAASVQLVLVSEDPAVALWADDVGVDRAAVVSFQR